MTEHVGRKFKKIELAKPKVAQGGCEPGAGKVAAGGCAPGPGTDPNAAPC